MSNVILPRGRRKKYLGTVFLSPAEQRVVALIFQGLTIADMAEALCVTVKAVKGHIGRLNVKMGTKNRAEVLAWWIQEKHLPAIQEQINRIVSIERAK